MPKDSGEVNGHGSQRLSSGLLFAVLCLTSTIMLRGARTLSCRLRTLPQCRFITSTPLEIPTKTQGVLPTSQSAIVSKMQFFNSVTPDGSQIPTYRVIDGSGKAIEGAELPEVSYMWHMLWSTANDMRRLMKSWLGNCQYSPLLYKLHD